MQYNNLLSVHATLVAFVCVYACVSNTQAPYTQGVGRPYPPHKWPKMGLIYESEARERKVEAGSDFYITQLRMSFLALH